jgi:aspartate kinase
MNIQVMKFGGTSVGDADCIRRTAEIIFNASKENKVVAVVSAMGGVTNYLIDAAKRAERGDHAAADDIAAILRAKHFDAIDALVHDDEKNKKLKLAIENLITEVWNFCHGTSLLQELTPRAMDALSGAGEKFSCRLVAAALREMGAKSEAVEATDLIVTTDDHSRAEPLPDETSAKTKARLMPLLEDDVIPIVTGFIGATESGVLTTLGRGGSDYSATILGAALNADEVIIWTDVDGVMTCDPRLVPSARLLRFISYNEAAELAHFGAKVLHPKTLRPVADAGIPVWIRNSFAPENLGTKITPTGNPTTSGVKAITSISGVSLITVGGRGIVGVIGVAAKTFAAAASVNANVLMISQASSENDICFIVPTADAEKTVKALKQTFALNLAHHQVEHITVDHNICIVAVIGERMHGIPGLAGRIFNAVGKHNISVNVIAQGSSEYNVSFVINADAMKEALQALHDEFELHIKPSNI